MKNIGFTPLSASLWSVLFLPLLSWHFFLKSHATKRARVFYSPVVGDYALPLKVTSCQNKPVPTLHTIRIINILNIHLFLYNLYQDIFSTLFFKLRHFANFQCSIYLFSAKTFHKCLFKVLQSTEELITNICCVSLMLFKKLFHPCICKTQQCVFEIDLQKMY